MDTELHADFGIRYHPESDFLSLLGGEVVHAGEGCGVILSGESIYFYKVSTGELQFFFYWDCSYYSHRSDYLAAVVHHLCFHATGF